MKIEMKVAYNKMRAWKRVEVAEWDVVNVPIQTIKISRMSE